jgi:hypothetical protein
MMPHDRIGPSVGLAQWAGPSAPLSNFKQVAAPEPGPVAQRDCVLAVQPSPQARRSEPMRSQVSRREMCRIGCWAAARLLQVAMSVVPWPPQAACSTSSAPLRVLAASASLSLSVHCPLSIVLHSAVEPVSVQPKLSSGPPPFGACPAIEHQ